MALAFLAFAWLLGTVAASFAGVDAAALVATSAAFGALAIAVRPRLETLVVLVLAVPIIALAFWRYDATVPDPNGGVARLNESGTVTLRGVVDDEPQERTTSLVYRIDVREVRHGSSWRHESGTVLVRTPLYTRFEYGDLIEFMGELETPPSFPDFDYREYLLRQGVTSLLAYPETKLVEHGHGGALKSAIIDVRHRLSDALSDVLPQPHSSLAAGVLFGAREEMPADLREDMAATGTSHLVAVSGQNVSMLAGLIIAMLAWVVGRRYAVGFALASILGYTFLVGTDASVVRAAVMGVLYVLSIGLGRQHTAPIALVYAGAVMTALDPQVVHDISFQLSFAATLGLVTLAPQISVRLTAAVAQASVAAAVPGARMLTETLAVTLAAIAFTVPITAVNFDQISLMAPIANLFAVPAFIAVAFSGALAAGLAIVTPIPSSWLVWIAWPPAEYMIRSIEVAAQMPGASVKLSGVSVEYAIAWYAVLCALTAWLARTPVEEVETVEVSSRAGRFAPALALAGVVALATVLVWPSLSSGSDGRVSVTVMDVGQGDAILIEDDGGHRVLVDGGPSGQAIRAALGRSLPFYERRIDMVVLTHPQADHMAGLIEVLDGYDVGAVLTSAATSDTGLYEEWKAAVARSGARVTVADRGQTIALDGATIDVLSPDADDPLLVTGDLNDASTVLRLTAGGVSFLLTGDLGEAGEAALMRSGVDLDATVLKIGHHGSRTSTSAAFLSRVAPSVGLISAGAGNAFGHPAEDTLARLGGEAVLRTDEDGDVTVSTDGERVWVNTQR